MKIFAVLLAAIPALGMLAFSQSAPRHGSAFACNRLALNPEQRRHHFDELSPKLLSRTKGIRELADGYQFELQSDAATFQLAAEWVGEERLCCPFFDISLRMEREDGPLYLGLTGREGVKQFIKSDFARWFKR